MATVFEIRKKEFDQAKKELDAYTGQIKSIQSNPMGSGIQPELVKKMANFIIAGNRLTELWLPEDEEDKTLMEDI